MKEFVNEYLFLIIVALCGIGMIFAGVFFESGIPNLRTGSGESSKYKAIAFGIILVFLGFGGIYQNINGRKKK